MNIQTLREGLALMGASFSVTDNSFYFELRGVTILIERSLSEEEMEAALFFLKLNIKNWYQLAKEAVKEEEGGCHEEA